MTTPKYEIREGAREKEKKKKNRHRIITNSDLQYTIGQNALYSEKNKNKKASFSDITKIKIWPR